MKTLCTILVALLASVTAYSQSDEVIRLSEPVQETEKYEVFGAEVDQWNDAITLAEIVEAGNKFEGKTVTVETDVAEVCQKKGCFFVANDESYSARITFKDYGFFMPTDSKGKKVKLVGVFEVKELSEDQAKHYAEDAGEDPDAIEGAQKEYSIVATSIMVPKS